MQKFSLNLDLLSFSEADIETYQKKPIESLMAIYFSKALLKASTEAYFKECDHVRPWCGFRFNKRRKFSIH